MALFAIRCDRCGRDVQVSLVEQKDGIATCFYCRLGIKLQEPSMITDKEPQGFIGDD